MSLRLMLDENISYVIAEQARLKHPQILIDSVHTWREGAFMSEPDDLLLAALHTEAWTLVTYDRKMLSERPYLFDGTVSHSGVLFMDKRTVAPYDIGGLVLALCDFWLAHQNDDWNGRIAYLKKPRRK